MNLNQNLHHVVRASPLVVSVVTCHRHLSGAIFGTAVTHSRQHHDDAPPVNLPSTTTDANASLWSLPMTYAGLFFAHLPFLAIPKPFHRPSLFDITGLLKSPTPNMTRSILETRHQEFALLAAKCFCRHTTWRGF